MKSNSEVEKLLIERIRQSDAAAWRDLIARYEGRLLAFAESRVGNRAHSEDIVQETFIGFLTSLPNYDARRSLESYLFSICAYKLTDLLRREGRRPALSLSNPKDSQDGSWEVSGGQRGASSIVRSGERKTLEKEALQEALSKQIRRWKEKGEWQKLKCAELLFVRGFGNKEVSAKLHLSEQQIANYKFDFLARMKNAIRQQDLSEEVFPELYESPS
ncbi:MAG: sigma-70 family RNA polymerase sigma factor [Pirellulaceae bacterium]|nr:sigma-70 family RNA polymerase sigma factor [Pirellulaceae bacterium]